MIFVKIMTFLRVDKMRHSPRLNDKKISFFVIFWGTPQSRSIIPNPAHHIFFTLKNCAGVRISWSLWIVPFSDLKIVNFRRDVCIGLEGLNSKNNIAYVLEEE